MEDEVKTDIEVELEHGGGAAATLTGLAAYANVGAVSSADEIDGDCTKVRCAPIRRSFILEHPSAWSINRSGVLCLGGIG